MKALGYRFQQEFHGRDSKKNSMEGGIASVGTAVLEPVRKEMYARFDNYR